MADTAETYIFLLTWTDQGLRDTSNSVERAMRTVRAMEELGVRIFETYWTVGPFDMVMVAECPDQATAHAISLDMASRGNVRATTLRGFDRSEMEQVVGLVEAVRGRREASSAV
jgi:uncharacterized protein with GYD domain